MKLLIGAIVVGVALIVGVVSKKVFKKEDNVVEEIAEEVIKKQTGHDIDLSPASKEIKNGNKK